MKVKSLMAVLGLLALTGCAAQMVSIREIPPESAVAGGQDLSRFPKVEIRFVPKANPVQVDGDLSEWADADWMVLNRAEQFSGEGWSGVEDLSGRLALAYDAENLYIGVEVTDDVTVWEFTGSDLWQGDSFQISIDPWLARSKGAYSEDVVEFGFSGREGESAVQTWRWACGRTLGPGPLPAQAALAQPAETLRRYELAVPLKELGTWRPSLTLKSGGSWLINDNDGSGREGYLEWTPGIGGTKDPSQYGVFHFAQPPEGVEMPALMAKFRWDRAVVAQGRPLEVQMNILSQGSDRPATVKVRIDPEKGGMASELAVPMEPGRHAFAVSLDSNKISVGRHKISIELDDGHGYTATTSRSVYIYPPARYDYYK
jgi:hypothetical protein